MAEEESRAWEKLLLESMKAGRQRIKALDPGAYSRAFLGGA